jgi:hypothetical protein
MVSDRSNGVYRGIILAIAGLILIGSSQPPKSSNQGGDTDTAANISDAANSISTALIQAGKSGEKDGGCQDRKDKRDSDLCAQWKAADAADNAANYAFWTLVISTFGTGLLVWTLWETRDTSHRELRAYLRIEPVGEGVVQPDKKISWPFQIINYGATPATHCVIESSVVVRPPDWDWQKQTSLPHDTIVRPEITIHPDSPSVIKLEMDNPLPREVFDAIMGGKAVVFGKGIVQYRDVFRRRRFTSFQVEFHGADAGKGGIGGRIRIAARGNDFS